MLDAYPGGPGNKSPRLDGFAYRRTAELLQLGEGTLIFDPESAVAKAISARAHTMVDKGMNPYRIAVVSSMAQIDLSESIYLRREAALEDISDH